MLSSPLLLAVILWLSKLCSSYHVVITSITASFGHWTPLLQISMELIRNNKHFVTFIIDEKYAYYLDIITKNDKFDESSYQIIYSQSETPLDIDKLQQSNVQVRDGLIKQAAISFLPKAVFLNCSYSDNHCQPSQNPELEAVINYNLKHKQNDISSLKFDKKVDLCLMDTFNIFDIALCNELFNIPTIITMIPALISKAEYYHFRSTYIYLNDPFQLDFYSNMINGTVMSYKQKWINFITNAVYIINQKLTSYFIIRPILQQLNGIMFDINIDKSFNIDKYKNGFVDFWDQSVIIGSLATPFTNVLYSRPRVKQFGFLIYDETKDDHGTDNELFTWIEQNDTPILLISMGSVHTLPINILQKIYQKLRIHCKINKYRVIWALRQNIYDNQSNDDLNHEMNNFKIMEYVPQLQLLKHSNIKLFMTHCGEGSVAESIYTKTLMILYPILATQFMVGQRVKEIGAGLLIEDRENLSDFLSIIDTLLLNKETMKMYQEQLNMVHDMIAYNGGVSDAVDFIEYCARFGIKHLLCSYGHDYECDETMKPWYQETIMDVVIISVLLVIFVTITMKKCVIDRLLQCKRGGRKSKTE